MIEQEAYEANPLIMNGRTYKVLGCILIAAGCVGFLTVADELRHSGEFFAVLGILLSGVALLVAGLYPGTASVLALKWLPVGIAVGALGGALVDRVVTGVSLGLLLGAFLARIGRARAA